MVLSIKACTGKCLEIHLGVMLKVVLGGLHEDPLGGKEGRKDAKIGGMRRKGNPALEKGRFKHTGKCRALRGAIVLTEGLKSATKGTRNSNAFVGW